MATRTISKAEGFELVYKAFQDINFKSFDFNTVKQSLIDYVKLYFPEVFNDFIESSEFIAHLEIFAYVAELFIYRVDINSHENFLPVANRKESVLRLAKFISYNGSRNVAGRGLLKINSIQTSEAIYDARGRTLQNVAIVWNDQLNPYWKEHFIQVFNRISSQPYGTVNANERIQFQDMLFELYQLNNLPTETGVLPFSVTAAGQTIPMESVPVQLTKSGPIERRPQGGAGQFSLVYGSDGLGDQSNMTGFFMMTKQGTLSRTRVQLDGRTPNQTVDINIDNINETDVWVNNVDPTTNEILDDGSIGFGKSGEWVSINAESAENVIFNTLANPNKYEIATRDNDQITVVFGDGEFASVPSGTFDIWTRSSMNDDLIIPKANIQDITFTFRYQDERNQQHTLTIVAGITAPIQNSYASEDIERIRRVAPSVYYTQDRMVNARDYNSYLLKDPSILKLKAINRTFAGQSKYRAYDDFGGDPSETYDDVQLFGTDLAVFFDNDASYQYVSSFVDPMVLVNNNIEPILANGDFNTYCVVHGYANTNRLVFNNSVGMIVDPTDSTVTVPDFLNPLTNKLERTSILYALGADVVVGGVTYTNPNATFPVKIYFDSDLMRWRTTVTSTFDPFPQKTDPTILIQVDKTTIGFNKWVVQNTTTKVVAHSNTTRFWNTTTDPVLSFDTGNRSKDTIEILKLNTSANRNQLLTQSITVPVTGQPTIDVTYKEAGQNNVSQLLLAGVTAYTSQLVLDPLLDPTYTFTGTFIQDQQIELPFYYTIGTNAILIDTENVVEGPATHAEVVTNLVTVPSSTVTTFNVKKYDRVLFNRTDVNAMWTVIDEPTPDHWVSQMQDTSGLYMVKRGRSALNFLWRHYTTQYHLIDPAVTNIVDALVLTKPYYVNMRRWLAGELNNRPVPPTPFELRTSYSKLLANAMLSDTVVLKPGKLRLLFGNKSIAELRGSFRVVRSSSSILTDNEIKIRIVDVIYDYFDISRWEFGQPFYFTELATAIHNELGMNIETVALAPLQLGESIDQILMQIVPKDDEIFMPDVTIDNIEIVNTMVRTNIKQIGLT